LERDDYDTADIVSEEIQKYEYSDGVQQLMTDLVEQVLNLETTQAMKTITMLKDIIRGE